MAWESRRKRRAWPARMLVALSCCAMVLLAGCLMDGSDDDTDGTDGPDGTGTDDGTDDGNGDAATATLSFIDHATLGPILVDQEDFTLYVFTPDEANQSNCTDGCLDAWPPALVEGDVDAPAGVADAIGTMQRDDASTQLTYHGLPLYRFVQDTGGGEAKGDGRGGVWFVVREPPEDPSGLDGRGNFTTRGGNHTYQGDVTGYLAAPDDGSGDVGVVMIHEWWGLNDNVRHMADLLASHGYRVLAVDLFNGSVADDADDARAQVQALDQDEALGNMRAAAAELRDQGATRIASLGWCFGGGQSLQLAMSQEDLSAVVLYYGTPLVTDEAELMAIDAPLQGIFGEDDQAIPEDQVDAFETALGNLSIDNEVYMYPDVGHAFANPSSDSWSAWQSQDAWSRTLDFLDANA